MEAGGGDLGAGARGYVLKDADDEELVRAMWTVGRTKLHVADRSQASVLARRRGLGTE